MNVQGKSEQVQVRIEWVGGGATEGAVIRPVSRLSDLSTYPQLCQQVRTLTEAGWTAKAIAQAVTEAGYHSRRANERIGAQTIATLQRRLGVSPPRPRLRQRDGLLPDEWWPAELVRLLEIPRASLQHWIRRGWVRARKLEEPVQRWVVWADEAERERLRTYHQRTLGEDFRQRWATAPLPNKPPRSILHSKQDKKGTNHGSHAETENHGEG